MTDFRSRLLIELDELTGRLERLERFILSDDFEVIPEIERADLSEQLAHMQGYHQVLMRRASRQCGNA